MLSNLRNFKKLKTLNDFCELDEPYKTSVNSPPECPQENQAILRMLVRPKYGDFKIPPELEWLRESILSLAKLDEEITGIKNSWCYVTVRHGEWKFATDDEWHFDGASFRVEIIPERNYIWFNHTPTQVKVGTLAPFNQIETQGRYDREVFDPNKHNLFVYVNNNIKNVKLLEAEPKAWNLISPFCFHRRNPNLENNNRTFIRISFIDIEVRDVNCTQNSLLPTEAYGRNPVKSFRNKLFNY